MKCPHCDQETDPTLLYCKMCGMPVEVDEAAVAEHLERDDARVEIDHAEDVTRALLFSMIIFLVATIAFRLIVVRPVTGDVSPGYYAPAKVIDDKNIEPTATVEFVIPPIEIPSDADLEALKAKRK